MLPLSRRIAVSANVIFFPCTRLEIKFILSYLILPENVPKYILLLVMACRCVQQICFEMAVACSS